MLRARHISRLAVLTLALLLGGCVVYPYGGYYGYYGPGYAAYPAVTVAGGWGWGWGWGWGHPGWGWGHPGWGWRRW
jgi:hypothetical protein